MGDVVKWLRGMADYTRKTTTNGYRYDEAADEIERLRAALTETLTGYIDTQYFDPDIAARARAALEAPLAGMQREDAR